ncbi:hypothetical protein CW740_07010 [Kangiella profundi]|uniref:Uncharacterized protein n=1 Tax=Kangiella profundi TaxID=1561924 RepID=A0A2K9A8G2_9GAMM|nr:hypothetical protein [Kangiella profundi]AUD79010.1 hypothetical protein CW740_07010 [Kangiella profundi]GGF02257.1 hypothetical protein GCM10011356_14930 [Kangiella profundi]
MRTKSIKYFQYKIANEHSKGESVRLGYKCFEILQRDSGLTHQKTIIEEHYDTKARVQLDFKGYIKIAIFNLVGLPVVYAIYLYIYLIYLNNDSSFSFISYLISFIPGMSLFFVIGFTTSLITYPIYRWWCDKRRGQVMTGKFAMIRERQEKSAG